MRDFLLFDDAPTVGVARSSPLHHSSTHEHHSVLLHQMMSPRALKMGIWVHDTLLSSTARSWCVLAAAAALNSRSITERCTRTLPVTLTPVTWRE
jgi:hypothetical protein